MFKDDEPLKRFSNNKVKSGRIARGLISFQKYDFDVFYKKETENVRADALSEMSLLTEIEPNITNIDLINE